MADPSELTEVKAWIHYYAPEPLKTKLEVIIKDAEHMQEIREIVQADGLASDGYEMIQWALEEKAKKSES